MKLKERSKARQLRHRGFSIKQIATILDISKSSVSSWVRDIELSKDELANINERSRLGREHARESRLKNILNERTTLYEKCKAEILLLSSRDLWIAGIMLYAGEGYKSERVSGQQVEFPNSNPDIL